MTYDIDEIIKILRDNKDRWIVPIVTELASRSHDPYKVLISTLISLRTKDEVTRGASQRLFSIASTPSAMIDTPVEDIAAAIFPAGFYRNKAKNIKEVSRLIIEQYHGRVPDDLDVLLSLPGVGRKTANLVLTQGYGIEAICVDTHVHRITNRWGYVTTKTPNDTEFELREKLPRKYWIEINDLLVAFGQNVCRPISPLCSQCPLHVFCKRVGVTNSR